MAAVEPRNFESNDRQQQQQHMDIQPQHANAESPNSLVERETKGGSRDVSQDSCDGDHAPVPEKIVKDRGTFAVNPALAVLPAHGEVSFEVSFSPGSLGLSG